MAGEFNRLHDRRAPAVLVVNNGDPEATRAWAAEIQARFPVLVQEKHSLSKRYEAFVTPFAFLIDEAGRVEAQGIVSTRQYLGFVLSGGGVTSKHPGGAEAGPTVDPDPAPSTLSKELSHV
jgi:hypothetical protein